MLKTYLTCPRCGTCSCPVMAKVYLGNGAEPDRQDAYCPVCELTFSQQREEDRDDD